MATPLQEAYDSFQSNIDEDLTGKEELIYTIFKKAKSKCYKYVKHSLDYVLTDEIFFDGNFNDDLDDDELTLIGLEMLYEYKRRRKEYLEAMKNNLGTKDFQAFPKKVEELKQLGESMRDLKIEINELKQDLNTYKYEE